MHLENNYLIYEKLVNVCLLLIIRHVKHKKPILH